MRGRDLAHDLASQLKMFSAVEAKGMRHGLIELVRGDGEKSGGELFIRKRKVTNRTEREQPAPGGC